MNPTELLTGLDFNRLPLKQFIVYRRCSQIDGATQGTGDIDILIDPSFLEEFRGILLKMRAIEAIPCNHHDNRTRSREEWFVPLNGAAGPVHLDVVTELLTGPRYNKGLHLSSYTEVGSSLYLTKDGVRLQVADERCLIMQAIAKEAFHHFYLRSSKTMLSILSEVTATTDVVTPWGEVTCSGGDCRISGALLSRCRRALLQENGYTFLRTVRLWSGHYIKKLLYLLERSLETTGLLHSPKRRFVSGGFVIALLGPDGAGKSTQVRRLRNYFVVKFGTRLEYMGHSGGASKVLHAWGQNTKKVVRSKKQTTENPKVKHHLEDAARSVWGLWIALYRLTRVSKARRLARSGYLVFSDRWPQNIERGLMDGPVRRVTSKTLRPIEFLFFIEELLYDRIARVSPDIQFHLTLPYELAEERKPGELTEADFSRRVHLMNVLREQDPQIFSIDASQDQDQVFTDLLTQVWEHLHSACEPQERGSRL